MWIGWVRSVGHGVDNVPTYTPTTLANTPTITAPTHQVRSLGHDVGKARRGAAGVGARGAWPGGKRGVLGARLKRGRGN
jgi:hypothetical protein